MLGLQVFALSTMRLQISTVLVAAAFMAGHSTMAAAQALSCTGFLHGRDGSWRSMQDGPVFGPSGRVKIVVGEILRPTEQTAKGEIARALNDLCESH